MSHDNRQTRRAERFKRITLALAAEGELPTAFRLFVKGWNDTENGRFLFDSKAAKAVMDAYQAWGVDLMIDLNHQSLEVEPGGPDPTSHDARGWCKLELRPDGSLWAVDVRWTPDGAARLEQKRQRYVSPAFEIDPKTKRVTKMINVAITAMPATHNTPALVAASAKGGKTVDPKLIQQALDAVEKGDAKAALEILKGLIASAAGADSSSDGDDPGSEGDGADGVSPPATESVEPPKQVANDAADGDGGPPSSKPGDDDGDENKPQKKALRLMLCRMAGVKTFAEAVSEVERWRASHLTLETERKQLAAERATLESAERRSLAVALITCGAEFPSTVWADAGEKKPSKLKDRWAKMPIAELRTHVAEQKAARGGRRAPTPPPGDSGGRAVATSVALDDGYTVELTAEQVRICKSQGTDLKDFATLLARRDGRK